MRKVNKALAAGDSNASSSTYDMEDEESDDETTEEVHSSPFFPTITVGHCGDEESYRKKNTCPYSS
jgi:hypothetical protein